MEDGQRDIPPDSGKIIGETAVFCDAAGKLHEFSRKCPHAGCMVEWNEAEKTWDCPCHGSRVAATGKLLRGPAERGLWPREGADI